MTELVLLPGMDGTTRLFDPFIAALGNRISTRAIAYPPGGATGYAELSAWIRQQLPPGDFVLLGESFGGPLAATLAAERPVGLRGLVLCATFLSNPRPMARYLSPLVGVLGMSQGLAAIASPALLGWRPNAHVREQFIASVGALTARTLRGRLRAVLGSDGPTRFSAIDVPVLCLRATQDWLVPRSAAEAMRVILPGVRIVDVEGPHALLLTAPTTCAALVEEFVGTITAGD